MVTDADHIIGIELCRGLPGKCACEKVRAENIAFQIGGIVEGLRRFRLHLGHWLIHDGGTLRRRTRCIEIWVGILHRSEAHTSELQSPMRISYDEFCLQNNNTTS